MSKRNLIIVGNWKMNKSISETKKFLNEFKKLYTKESSKIKTTTKFGIGAPSINLSTIKGMKVKPSMIVAAENMSQHDSGAYTGELSQSMIKSVGANAVIIGHSERRQYFGETDKDVNEKTKKALESKLLPIVCIGETLKQRKDKSWKRVLTKQIKEAFKGIKKEDATKVVIAYEPIWAIGTGVTASSNEAQEACKFVRSKITSLYSKELSEKVQIQYGGSVKPDNVSELMTQPDIDGALVGGASLDPKMFIKLLTLNK